MLKLRTPGMAFYSMLMLAGCYESPTEVTNYEPGVYKGAPDPLLQKQGASRNEELIQRFNMVQTDR